MDRLRSQRRTEQGPALVQRLFRGTNALELSKQVRQQRQGDILPAAACGANASETDAALTYGEVVPSSFVAIMNSIRAPLTKVRGCSNSSGSGGLVFYDLGCGQGKACFAALLEPNCYFRKIVGIEIMGELVAIALKVKAKLLLAMEMAEGMSGGETETTTSSAVTTPDLGSDMVAYARQLLLESNGSIERGSFANVLSKKLGSKVYKRRVLQVFGTYSKFFDFLISSKAVVVNERNCLVISDYNNDYNENNNSDHSNDNNDNNNNSDNNNTNNGSDSMDNTAAIAACLASPRVAGILPLRHDIDLNFIVGDIFEVNDEHPIDSDWCEAADVCYCANLLFSEGMIHALSRKVVGMKAGAVFISLRQLDEDITAGRAVLLEESFYKMSWHYASVFVYLIL